jgi:hypothetical protein
LLVLDFLKIWNQLNTCFGLLGYVGPISICSWKGHFFLDHSLRLFGCEHTFYTNEKYFTLQDYIYFFLGMIEFNNIKTNPLILIVSHYFYGSKRLFKVQSQFAIFSFVVLEFCLAPA